MTGCVHHWLFEASTEASWAKCKKCKSRRYFTGGYSNPSGFVGLNYSRGKGFDPKGKLA